MRSLDSQSLLAAFQRRSRALIIGLTATVLIAVVLLETADLWWGYGRSIAIAEKKATNLASVLASVAATRRRRSGRCGCLGSDP